MAEQTYLEKLKDVVGSSNVTAQAKAAINWFRSLIENYGVAGLRCKFTNETPESILARHKEYSPQAYLGNMYFFYYNPKHKKTLPWYDTFPLVFPVDLYPDGFLGLNFHYLNPKWRAMLLDRVTARVTTGAIIHWNKIAKIPFAPKSIVNGFINSMFFFKYWNCRLQQMCHRFPPETLFLSVACYGSACASLEPKTQIFIGLRLYTS